MPESLNRLRLQPSFLEIKDKKMENLIQKANSLVNFVRSNVIIGQEVHFRVLIGYIQLLRDSLITNQHNIPISKRIIHITSKINNIRKNLTDDGMPTTIIDTIANEVSNFIELLNER